MAIKVREKRVTVSGPKEFFSKLSRGLMLPIALLPVAGLFLGIGAGVENIILQVNPDATAAALLLPDVVKSIGDIIFGNLPTLFCLGVVVAFADDAGVAVLAGVVGWIVFNATQSTMIWSATDSTGAAVYNILWYTNVPASVVTNNVGITSLQTSVFGGITVGLFVSYLYNKFHTFQMPAVLGFFSGSRFVPIITFMMMPLLGFFFLMIWPIFGIALNNFGELLGKAPTGLDTFVFGFTERALIPFGLHHAFYTPLWFTSAGGQMVATTAGAANPIAGNLIAQGNNSMWFAMQSTGLSFGALDVATTPFAGAGALTVGNTIDGYTYLGVAGSGSALDGTSLKGMDIWITSGVNPGAYMQGKFPVMLFGLPAAGAAMIMAAKKENREVAISIIGAAAVTSFLTGITEPIEFTFIFLAPALYYGFHCVMAALSFMSLDLLHSHIGMTFSGGIIDYALFGILPDAVGMHSNCYWVLLIGIVYAPVYYFVFYFYITKFDVKTPGRAEGEVKMITKADYQASKSGEAETADAGPVGSKIPADRRARLLELEENLGGLDNLEVIDACITRLRITVTDRSKLNDDALKAMGAMGIVGNGKAVQVIFGAEADRFKQELKALRAERAEGN